MTFLIEYDRSQGRLITLKSFDDSQFRDAEKARLNRELELNRNGANHEVVLLNAASEADLRRTHRRYFESLRQIAESVGQSDE